MRFPPIPLDERAGLTALALLSDEQVASLLAILESTPLNINRDRFSASVRHIDGVDHDGLLRAVSAVLYLHAYASGTDISTDAFVRDVVDSLAASGVDTDSAKRLLVVLPRFMDCDGLRLQAKAVDLQVDHARTFRNARILTDFRPVFDMASAERVVGALVFHTLKISYYGSDGPQEIFIALDDDDLAGLTKAIAKAESKGRVLREIVVTKLGLNDFGTGSSEEV